MSNIADDQGNVIGGHLKEGCIIHTTAELVTQELPFTFSRECDEQTKFKELNIK